MKILLASSSFLPVMGGLQEAVSQLAKEFHLAGHSVKVLTNRYPVRLPSKEIIDGIPVARMIFPSFHRDPEHAVPILKYWAALFIGCCNFLRLLFFIVRQKPDVVNCHFIGTQAPYFLFSAKLLRIPFIISMHGDDVEGLPKRSRANRRRFELILNKADHITACSQFLLNKAMRMLPAIKEKSTYIWNGIRPGEFAGVEPYNHPRPYLFAAGRFFKKKGFDVLLKAFRRLVDAGHKRVDLILAGDGPESENLQAIAEELSLPKINRDSSEGGVLFWGKASRSEMKSLLKGSELFVIPSRLEPFGIVALEALVSKKKIVASRVGGLSELADAFGFSVVEPDSPEALSEALLVELSSSQINVSYNCDIITWEQSAAKYLTAFKRVLECEKN